MMTSVYSYGLDGQLRSATAADGAVSEFLWDGLALIRRDGVDYLNEPHSNGGSPILASDGRAFFNDILGTSQGVLNDGGYKASSLTAFGDGADGDLFFTGKPKVDDALGYAFLFRNYRPDNGKWLTADPMGYPDGWNNLAYGNNQVTDGFDAKGGKWGNTEFVAYYYRLSGADWLDTDDMGLTNDVWNVITGTHDIINKVKTQIDDLVKNNVKNTSFSSGSSSTAYNTSRSYAFGSICFSMGGGTVSTWSSISYSWDEYTIEDVLYKGYSWSANMTVYYSDIFMDPLDVGIELGNAYGYSHTWNNVTHNGYGSIKLE